MFWAGFAWLPIPVSWCSLSGNLVKESGGVLFGGGVFSRKEKIYLLICISQRLDASLWIFMRSSFFYFKGFCLFIFFFLNICHRWLVGALFDPVCFAWGLAALQKPRGACVGYFNELSTSEWWIGVSDLSVCSAPSEHSTAGVLLHEPGATADARAFTTKTHEGTRGDLFLAAEKNK